MKIFHRSSFPLHVLVQMMIGRSAFSCWLSFVLILWTDSALSYPQKHVPYPTLAEKDDGFPASSTNLTSSNATGHTRNTTSANRPGQASSKMAVSGTWKGGSAPKQVHQAPIDSGIGSSAPSEAMMPPPVPPRPSEAVLALQQQPERPTNRSSEPPTVEQLVHPDFKVSVSILPVKSAVTGQKLTKPLQEAAGAGNVSEIQENARQIGQEKTAMSYGAGEAGSTVPDKADAGSALIDPFQPIATTAPPSVFPQRGDHPVARKNIVSVHSKLLLISSGLPIGPLGTAGGCIRTPGRCIPASHLLLARFLIQQGTWLT